MVKIVVKNWDGGTMGHAMFKKYIMPNECASSMLAYRVKAIKNLNCFYRLGVASRAIFGG